MSELETAPTQIPGPTKNASRGWIFKLTLAYVGANIAWAGPGQVLIAPKVEELTNGPVWGIFSSVKEDNFAVIGAVTAIFAVLSGPLWGVISDRTTSRWGRRTPWMAIGTVLIALTMVAAGFSQSLPALLLSWTAFQIALNAVLTPMAAAIPDHVPEVQRGLVSGWYGFGYTLAVVIGTGLGTLATVLYPGSWGITVGYLLCALACIIAMIPLLLDRWEAPLSQTARAAREPFRWQDLGGLFWVDVRKFPDFGWAWLTRFLVTLSTSVTLFYLYYYLQDSIGLVRDNAPSGEGGLRVSEGVLILTAVYALAVFATVVVSGIISDRMGKRRIFVSVASILIGLATLVIAFAPTFAVVIAGALVLGLGTGVFTSIDFALISQVLPAAEDTGKDVGIIHLAITLPNILSPILAAFLVGYLGGYTTMYLVAGALAIVGGLLVYKIKSVD